VNIIVIAAALRHLARRAPAVITAGDALIVFAALGAMALPVLADLAAMVADRHADAGAVAAGTLAAAAQITLGMIGCTPGLAGQRVDARTMIGIAAGRIMAAEAAVAPEQATLIAGGVLAGILAQIGHAAAADFRIAEMLGGLLALLVLRLSDAVLAHDSGGMTALAGEVTLDTALGDTVIADAADVARIAALAHAVILAIGDAVAALAPGGRRMLLAVAAVVAPLAAGRLRMIQTVAAKVTALAAGRAGVLHAVARQMAFLAADGSRMTLAVVHAVIGETASRLSMRALAGIVTLSAAGRRHMLLAVAVEMSPNAAGSAGVICTVALKMTLDPAGLRTAVILSVPLFVLRIAAGGLGRVIRGQRAGRKAHQQAQHQQRRYQLLHHRSFLLFRFCTVDTKTIDLLFHII